jgi:hypothetical protein
MRTIFTLLRVDNKNTKNQEEKISTKLELAVENLSDQIVRSVFSSVLLTLKISSD